MGYSTMTVRSYLGRSAIVILATLGTCAIPAAQAPTQTPSRFRSGIDLVTVDVVVLDGSGNPVQGLTRQDFTVLEDGRPQQVTEFQSVELPPPPQTPLPVRARAERRV